ncbi:MAG: TIGR00730 family Rossman fold protein [Waddliaceae bacterium]
MRKEPLREMPQRDNKDLFFGDAWRVFRIISEFVDGFETLTEIGPSVSIFGSARLKPASPYYNLAIDVGQKLGERGFAVITGGGPGIMEAANRGAQSVDSKSCGLAIDLPMESEINPFCDSKYSLKFRYFFVRKVMFIRYAQGYVFLPGGVGTLDELFEALTLIQTEKIKPFPIYLMGKKYWEGLLKWLVDPVLSSGCISQEDLDRINLSDDPEEVVAGIEAHFQQSHTLKNF